MIDAHTHLFFEQFQGDLENVVARAHDAGVHYFLNAGTTNDTSFQAIELSKKYESMYATVGIHPNDAHLATPEGLAEIEEWLTEPKVVAIGEIGLDYYHKETSPTVQRQVLINFFKIAERHKRPMVLHIRDAYDDIIQMLRDFFHPPVSGMSHCFSGTIDHLEQLVHLGLHISFAGPVTYPKNDALREAAKLCPINRILVETDAPYLPPQPMRGKRNEPAFMKETASCLAAIKGMPLEEFGKKTLENARNLFGINV